MPDDLRFDVVANDEASDVVDQVARKVDKLDGTEASVSVDTGDSVAELKRLSDAEERADQSARGLGEGSKIGGNAVADLAGPLGNAEGAASTAGGVFDGLGDIVEGLAPKFGIAEQAAANIATGLGLVGVAVAAGAAAWQFFTDKQNKAREAQQKAREETEKLRDAQLDLNAAVRARDLDKAVEQFRKLADEALDGEGALSGLADAAAQAGVPFDDLLAFMTGAVDELPTLTRLQAGYNDELARSLDPAATKAGLDSQITGLRDVQDEAGAVRDAYLGVGGASSTAASQSTEILRALGLVETQAGDTRTALQVMKGEMDMTTAMHDAVGDADALAGAVEAIGQAAKDAGTDSEAFRDAQFDAETAAETLRGTIVDLIEQYGAIPADVKTQILAELPTAAQAEWDAWIEEQERLHTAPIGAEVQRQREAERDLDEIAFPGGQPRRAPLTADAQTQAAEDELNRAARPRTVTITVDDVFFRNPVTGQRTQVPLGRAAAPGGGGGDVVPMGRLGAPAPAAAGSVAWPGAVQVHVDARGSVDPYAVGAAVRRALAADRRIAGAWRPGQGRAS